jgi:hypothetical protein
MTEVQLPTRADIYEYREDYGCSITEAKEALTRSVLLEALHDPRIDLRQVLRILIEELI